MDNKPRVLFFSTNDSTRSQMAEGFLRKFAGEELAVVSTAVEYPDSHPLAAEVLREIGVDISEQHARDRLKSKSTCLINGLPEKWVLVNDCLMLNAW